MALVFLLQFLFSVMSSVAWMHYFVVSRAAALLTFAVVQLLKLSWWVSFGALRSVADLLRSVLKHAIGLLANVVTSVACALIEAVASAATGSAQLAATGATEALPRVAEAVSGLMAQVVDRLWGRLEGSR